MVVEDSNKVGTGKRTYQVVASGSDRQALVMRQSVPSYLRSSTDRLLPTCNNVTISGQTIAYQLIALTLLTQLLMFVV